MSDKLKLSTTSPLIPIADMRADIYFFASQTRTWLFVDFRSLSRQMPLLRSMLLPGSDLTRRNKHAGLPLLVRPRRLPR